MKERRLKVSSVNQQRAGRWAGYRSVASIRLSGKWLEELGFKTGDRFVVEESPGCVVLRAEAAPKAEG
jgi:formylmethanofuran dehydrogenase subunit D